MKPCALLYCHLCGRIVLRIASALWRVMTLAIRLTSLHRVCIPMASLSRMSRLNALSAASSAFARRYASRKAAGLPGTGGTVVGVLGSQWGDEGKGKVIDVIAPQYVLHFCLGCITHAIMPHPLYTHVIYTIPVINYAVAHMTWPFVSLQL